MAGDWAKFRGFGALLTSMAYVLELPGVRNVGRLPDLTLRKARPGLI